MFWALKKSKKKQQQKCTIVRNFDFEFFIDVLYDRDSLPVRGWGCLSQIQRETALLLKTVKRMLCLLRLCFLCYTLICNL